MTNKNFILLLDYPTFYIYTSSNKGRNMTDTTKYKNVSLKHSTYSTLKALSKLLLPDTELSISKTVETIVNKEAKKYNGKIQRTNNK
jgi:hypothetical protein